MADGTRGDGSPRSTELQVRLTDRREVVIGGAALVATACISWPDSVEAAAKAGPERQPLQAGDRIQIIKGPLKDQLLRADMLDSGAPPFEAFPFATTDAVLRRRYRLNRLLVLRLESAEMDDETRARSVDGLLAYSALCTHRACTIKSWKAEERHLRCHCHLSEFAALSEGSVMSGPARRRLPMVPLGKDDEGFVVAVDGFTGRPGAAKK